MPKFGTKSTNKLLTTEKDIQTIMNEVIKIYDITVLYGERTPEKQFELYKKGRKLINNKWIIDNKEEVVTHCDGTIKKSNHNYTPSRAIDIVRWPIDFKDINACFQIAGIVYGISEQLYNQGKITHKIKWGGDWGKLGKKPSWPDYLHFELVY